MWCSHEKARATQGCIRKAAAVRKTESPAGCEETSPEMICAVLVTHTQNRWAHHINAEKGNQVDHKTGKIGLSEEKQQKKLLKLKHYTGVLKHTGPTSRVKIYTGNCSFHQPQ